MIAKKLFKVTTVLLFVTIFGTAWAVETDFQEKIVEVVESISAWGEPIRLDGKTLVPIFGLRLQSRAGEILVETIPQAVLVLEAERSYTLSLKSEYLPPEIPVEEVYNALVISAQKYLAGDDLEKARALLERTTALFPERAESHALLGKVLFALYQRTPDSPEREEYGIRAFMEFAKALDINPQNQEALLARARARLEVPEPLGSPELAIDDLSQVIQQNPERPEAYVLLGKAYLALNDLEKAKANFQRALELAPEDPEAQEGLAQIEENLQN